jgi:hypothetical protein
MDKDAAQMMQQQQASAMLHWGHSQHMMQPASMSLAQHAPQQEFVFGLPAPQLQQQGSADQTMEPGEAETDVQDAPMLQAEQLGQMMQQQLTVQMQQTEHPAAGQASQHEQRLQALQHQQQAQQLPGNLSRWPTAVFGGDGHGMPPTDITKSGSSIGTANVPPPITNHSSNTQAWGHGWIGSAPAAAAAVEAVSALTAQQDPAASDMQPDPMMDELDLQLPELDDLLQDIGRI